MFVERWKRLPKPMPWPSRTVIKRGCLPYGSAMFDTTFLLHSSEKLDKDNCCSVAKQAYTESNPLIIADYCHL